MICMVNLQRREYRHKNALIIAKAKKDYYKKNKNIILSKKRDYYKKNKNELKDRIYKYRDENPERRKSQCAKYREKNRLKIRKSSSIYGRNNRAKINSYIKNRKETSLDFRIRLRLRSRITMGLKLYIDGGKTNKSIGYGINIDSIINSLKPFPSNLSKYHLDHIRPLSSFTFTTEDGSANIKEIQEAFSPSNYQWLTIQENLKKGGKWDGY